MRKRINTSWSYLKSLAIIASICLSVYVICYVVYKLLKRMPIHADDFEPLGFLAHATIFYLVGHFDRTLEFDQNRLYINWIFSKQTIDLQEIKEIKITNWNVNESRIWRIRYGENRKSILFMPNPYDNHFEQFLAIVLTKNPNLKADEFHFKPLFGGLSMTIFRSKKE
jgi:hypothetical protein